MKQEFKVVIQRDGEWWIGWAEEIPGVNSQGTSMNELLENLKSALQEALEFDRDGTLASSGEHIEEECIQEKFLSYLIANGCFLVCEGVKHSWWSNFRNNCRSPVPRCGKINSVLAKKICRDLGIREP